MLKRLLLIFLLLVVPCIAQDLRPSAYLGKPGVVTVRAGKVQGSAGGVTALAAQDITPTVNATTYIYVDLSSTPIITTNTSGFPTSNYFPICTVIADINGTITSFTDSRPDYFMAGGSTPGGSNTQFQYNNNGVLAGASGLTTNGTSVGFNGNGTITSTPPFSAAANVGWKFCLYTNQACQGVATTTDVFYTAFSWFSFFASLPANNASGSTPDSNAVVSIKNDGTIFAKAYSTATNCSVNSVSPAACSAAAAGSFVVPTTTTSYTVNTTAVHAASRIFLFPHTDTRDLPGTPTCVAPAITAEPVVSATVAATSFTITIASTTGQTCWDYWIVN